MKTASTLLAALLFATSAALAADTMPPVKPATPNAAKPASLPASARSDARTASGEVKVAGTGGQQNRMKECNKQAKGQKGAERKAFMKSCLSTHKSS
ncbi:MAG: PsiF family protein [Pseudomonadota bacterium]|nr:PsiF family protein [Pseudomonadota bacterium]